MRRWINFRSYICRFEVLIDNVPLLFPEWSTSTVYHLRIWACILLVHTNAKTAFFKLVDKHRTVLHQYSDVQMEERQLEKEMCRVGGTQWRYRHSGWEIGEVKNEVPQSSAILQVGHGIDWRKKYDRSKQTLARWRRLCKLVFIDSSISNCNFVCRYVIVEIHVQASQWNIIITFFKVEYRCRKLITVHRDEILVSRRRTYENVRQERRI